MKRLFIGIVTLLLILPMAAKALTGSVSITCSKDTVAKGEEFTCDVMGSSDQEISGVHGVIKVSDNLYIVKVENEQGWVGEVDKVFDLYSDTAKKDSFKIGTVTLNGVEEGAAEVTLNDVYFVDPNSSFDKITISNIKTDLNVNTAASSIADQKADSVATGMYIPLILIGLVLIASPMIIKKVRANNKFNNI